jgi:hypothetical protein
MHVLRLIEIRFMQMFAVLTTLLVAMTPMAVAMSWARESLNPSAITLLVLWFVVSVIGALVASTAFWEGGYRDDQPYGEAVASMLPYVPKLLRPLLSLWWLTHFACCVGMAIILHSLAFDAAVEPAEDFGNLVGMSLLTLGTTYAGMLFLVLSLAVWQNSSAVRCVWRYRVAIDICIALLVPMISLLMRN